MDKPKYGGEKEVRRIHTTTQTTHWTIPKIDWCQVRSLLFTLTTIVLLLAIGAWVGWKLGRGGVDIFINSEEGQLSEKDRAQGVVEKKWTQVRIEKTSGHLAKPPPEEKEEPTVLEFNVINAPAIFGTDARAISFLFLSKKSGHYEKALEEYRSAAHELKGSSVTFAYVDVDREDTSRIVDFFAVGKEEGALPAIRLHSIEGERMLKFKPETSIDPEELRSSHIVDFARSHLAGELKPYYRSEPTPTDWDSEAVKVLTGENFDQVVMREGGDKHVFVEFYASWCGFCKKLEPIWEELAGKYKDHGNVIIAKIDGIANELPDQNVHAFPAIKLFPASGVDGVTEYQRQGIDYNGPRTVEGLSKFLDSFIHKA